MKYVFATLSLLLFFSCTVQKRRYQKGFYVSRGSVIPAEERNSSNKKINQQPELTLTADAGSGKIDLSLVQQNQTPKIGEEDSCDVLIFRDGTELRVKVTEVGTSEVRYKRCDNVTGPNYVSRKSDLFLIRYANGMKELMKEEAPKPENPTPRYNQPDRGPVYQNPTKPSPAANYALYSGIISLVSLLFAFMVPVLFVSSILSAINALRSARKFFLQEKLEPGVYAGRGKTIAGLTLALITLSFYLLLIIFILLLI